MSRTIDYAALTGMLETAAERIRGARDELSKLDAAVGDGDHGTAMFKVAGAMVGSIEKDQGGNMKLLLKSIGWAAMSTDAGSTSPLYGSLFMGMSEGLPEDGVLDGGRLAGMFEAGLAKVRKNTPAKVGDKTLLDALVPAVEAAGEAASGGATVDDVLAKAAAAGAQGAEATRDMKATRGRAKNIGERSIGHLDPGAVSMSLLFEGLASFAESGQTSGVQSSGKRGKRVDTFSSS